MYFYFCFEHCVSPIKHMAFHMRALYCRLQPHGSIATMLHHLTICSLLHVWSSSQFINSVHYEFTIGADYCVHAFSDALTLVGIV